MTIKVEIPNLQVLEKLLQQRLDEMLESLHRSDLKGYFFVKIEAKE